MKKFIYICICLIAILIFAALLFYFISSFLLGTNPYFADIGKSTDILQSAARKVVVNPPLSFLDDREIDNSNSFLTQRGVVEQTNLQRLSNGLPELKENHVLNTMAQAKLNDMLQKQYFEHYSPAGDGVENIAENFGYNFILIGENLAMGNFESDKILVQAWMDSPGHRANILNTGYSEVGIAVQKGIFEGRSVWLAVQHFGLPADVCPFSVSDLKDEIGHNEKEIDSMANQIAILREELQKEKQKWGPEYNKKVDEYNALVDSYNNLISQNKERIAHYNQEVRKFNECVGRYN